MTWTRRPWSRRPDAPSIYDIPKVLHSEGLDAYVVRRLGLPFRDVDWSEWDDLLRRVHRPARSVTIALVGKYVDLPDAYLSPAEALRAGGFGNDAKVNIRWVPSDDCQTPEGAAQALDGVDGVLVPGGFGVRGIEGKIGAVRHARDATASRCSVCAWACSAWPSRPPGTWPGWTGPTAPSSTRTPPFPVIATMADQEDVVAGERDMGGTMRLGLYPAALAEGSLVRELYGDDVVRGAAPAPVRGQQRLPGAAGAGRAGCLRAVAGRPPGGVRGAAPQHPPVLRRPPRPTRSSCPGRPGRTRCSAGWSRPPSRAPGLVGAAAPRQAVASRRAAASA